MPIAYVLALRRGRGIASNAGSDKVEALVAAEPIVSAMDSP